MIPETIDLGSGWYATLRPDGANLWKWELIRFAFDDPYEHRETSGYACTRWGARWEIRRALKRYRRAYERRSHGSDR